jgi:hypothetical protein
MPPLIIVSLNQMEAMIAGRCYISIRSKRKTKTPISITSKTIITTNTSATSITSTTRELAKSIIIQIQKIPILISSFCLKIGILKLLNFSDY